MRQAKASQRKKKVARKSVRSCRSQRCERCLLSSPSWLHSCRPVHESAKDKKREADRRFRLFCASGSPSVELVVQRERRQSAKHARHALRITSQPIEWRAPGTGWYGNQWVHADITNTQKHKHKLCVLITRPITRSLCFFTQTGRVCSADQPR
jgi:hypothetical protein